MIALRNFTINDISVLKGRYAHMNEADIVKMVNAWNTKRYKNRYYEMFAIVLEENIVGSISLYQHTETAISCAPEIFGEYREQGLATQAMEMALEYAKEIGYVIAVAQVRKDNNASNALHKKMRFEIDHEYINAKGNEVYFYIRLI